MKTKYFEYNRNGRSEKYSEFTEEEYLKAKEECSDGTARHASEERHDTDSTRESGIDIDELPKRAPEQTANNDGRHDFATLEA